MQNKGHFPSIQKVKEYFDKENYFNDTAGLPKFLFRGQTTNYQNLTPTFARLNDDGNLIGQCYTTFQFFTQRLATGLYGYRIEPHEALAVLQHYGFVTPQIDLTGTIDIAIFFATDNLQEGNKPVIYIVDTEKIKEQHNIIVTNHFFLVKEIEDDGLNNRWLRQDGYAIMPKDWFMTSVGRKFDLYDEAYSDFISYITFDPSDKENIIVDRKIVYDFGGDYTPQKLKSILEIYCGQNFQDSIHPVLKEIINKMI